MTTLRSTGVSSKLGIARNDLKDDLANVSSVVDLKQVVQYLALRVHELEKKLLREDHPVD